MRTLKAIVVGVAVYAGGCGVSALFSGRGDSARAGYPSSGDYMLDAMDTLTKAVMTQTTVLAAQGDDLERIRKEVARLRACLVDPKGNFGCGHE